MATKDSGGGMDFGVPSHASTVAGAMFFAQHLDDLTWGVSQEVLAREVEELVSMITDALGKTRSSEVWNLSEWTNFRVSNVDEAIALSKGWFDSRATYARRLVLTNAQVAQETALCRYVDNFLCYLSDLLRIIFSKYPEALTTGDAMINVKDVFANADLDSVLSWLTERTISDLSFRGFGDIEEYYNRRFGFDLIGDTAKREKVAFAIAARNLLVHRRGIIDSRFIQMSGLYSPKIGERVEIGDRAWYELIPAILESVRDIDERAAEKFGFHAALVLPLDRQRR